MPVAYKLAIKGAYPRRDWFNLLPLGQNIGPEKIIPDKCENQNSQGSNRGPDKWHDDIPEYPPLCDALYPRTFDKIKWQGFYKIAHEQSAKPGLKRRVKQKLSSDRIVKSGLDR